jgi:3-oxoacyl-[acyl-carrier protein] reductase
MHLCPMKHAVVTGSSKGLGKAFAKALAEEGYSLWLSARSGDALEQLAHELEVEFGVNVTWHVVDFTQDDATREYANLLSEKLEHVDVLINNAGTYVPDKLVGGEDCLDHHMQVNFRSAYMITQSLIPKLIAQKRGHIFNVCSVVNRKVRPEAASYTISKFALWGYHRLLHQSLLEHGVKVTGFFPASINTSSWDGEEVPREQFIQPEDIAAMMVHMLQMAPGTVPSEIDISSSDPSF